MAIKTQLRLNQITGSIGAGGGQINDNTASTQVIDSKDMSGILSHMASAIKRLHGGGSFQESNQGEIKMIDNQAQGFMIKSLDNKEYLKFVTTDNSEAIQIKDDAIKLQIGTGQDLNLYHNGTDSYIENTTGLLRIDPKSGERGIELAADGAVTLYHDNVAKVATDGGGVIVTGAVQADGIKLGDDEAIEFGSASGGDVSIDYDESATDSLLIKAVQDGADFKMVMAADRYDDGGDAWMTSIAGGGSGKLIMANDIASKGTFVEHFAITPNATVANSLAEFKGDLTVEGDLTVNGDTVTVNVATLTVEDKNIHLGKGAANATAIRGAGLDFEMASDVDAGFMRVGASDASILELKAPNAAGILTLDLNATKTITVAGALNIEADSVINQDLSTDSTAVVFAGLSLAEGNITNVGVLNADSIICDDAAVGLDIQFAGNTTLNKITLTDNLADALNVTESTNSYLKFVTSNSSEAVEVGKELKAMSGLRFGNAGVNDLFIPDNQAQALVIKEAGNTYAQFTTTDGSEAIVFHKPVSFADQNITNVGSVAADSIIVDDASVGLDIVMGGNTTLNKISLTDNLADALNITEAGNSYMKFSTANGQEGIEFGNKIEAKMGIMVSNGNASAGSINFAEDSDNGGHSLKLTVPDALAGDYTITLPGTDGNANQVLQTDGSGVTSWVDQSAGAISAKKFWLTPTGSVPKGQMVGTLNNVNWSTYGGGNAKQIDLSTIAHADEPRVVDVFVNGQMLLSGSELQRAGGQADYCFHIQTGVNRATSDVKFAFDLEADDTVVVVARA